MDTDRLTAAASRLATAIALCACALNALAAPAAALTPTFAPVGTYETGLGLASAEVVAVAENRLVVSNSADNSFDIVDISDPSEPELLRRVDGGPYGAGINSVAVRREKRVRGHVVQRGLIAAAFEADPLTSPGRVALFDLDGNPLGSAVVGALPDMVTFSPDGHFLLVANEGEPANGVDPEGSVSILGVGPFGDIRNPKHVGFAAFDEGGSRHDELDPGVRVTLPGSSVAQDLEPEYITVSPDSRLAFVTLQENNAVAVIQIPAARVLQILPLGLKDHSLEGHGLDPSDRDNAIAIASWPVFGMYQPDAIEVLQSGGETFLVTANEGDTGADPRAAVEEIRLGSNSYPLDPSTFPNAADLKQNAALGRLTVTRSTGDLDGDGDFDQIHVFGARSFSIWTATGELVFDSGDAFEQIVARSQPAFFNSDNEENNFDNRSDNKGPEPEGVAIGQVLGRTLAFIALERQGGVMIYDVTDPRAPEFLQYTNNRDFSQDPPGPDSGAEVIAFIDWFYSPTRLPMFAVGNEVSGTVTLYGLRDPDRAETVTLLHNNDGETTLEPLVNNAGGVNVPVAGVAAFKAVSDREIAGARAAGHSVLNVYAGDAFLASASLACSLPPNPPDSPVLDAVAQRLMPFDVHVLGNHEFDFNPDFLERFIRGFELNGLLLQPFLSANLDFSAEPGFADLTVPDGLITRDTPAGQVLARSAVIIDEVTGSRFGVVGATTPTLPSISSPRNVAVTPDLAQTAAAAQAEIDRLRSLGVRKIFFVSHLQDIANDRAIVRLLRHVDVAVAGGGDELLTNPGIPDAQELLPGETQPVAGTYPILETDAAGRTVPIVTTSGNYKYVGRLDVRFDARGEVAEVIAEQSFPRRVVVAGDAATQLAITDAVEPDEAIAEQVIEPLDECLAAFQQPVARTEVLLNVSRQGALPAFPTGVRTGETNGGNLIADAFLHSYDRFAPSLGLPARGPGNPVIAVQNGGGIRQNAGDVLPVGGVVPGAITRQNTLDVLAFLTNLIAVVNDVTPAQLKEILERSAATLPGAGGQFLQVGGFRVTYDSSGGAQELDAADNITVPGSRVVEVVLDDGTPIVQNGAVVVGAPSVRIVTNNFTAAGGDRYPTLRNNPNQLSFGETYEQALVEYLLTFPLDAGTGLPTISAADPRYAPAGAGRITIQSGP
jgi:2',3'-cyclic-nucleotide 2'-phosphodiesterase (5'-nucleotidase family)/DNA-binding beta-propeller fold protein YncE